MRYIYHTDCEIGEPAFFTKDEMNSRGKARNKFWRRLYQGWHVAPTGMGVPTHGIGAKSNIGNLLPPDKIPAAAY